MKLAMQLFLLAILAGCSAMTPTTTTESSFVIFDVQPATVDRRQLLDAITEAVQKNQSQVRVTKDIQTGDLPDKPVRFTLKDPFANTNIGALMARSGQSMKTPVCDSPVLTLASENSSVSGNTSFFLCVVRYTMGYSVNIYSTFTSTSGGISVGAMSKALAKSVVGDSSQYIPRTMNDVRAAAESAGGTVTILDSDIPASFKGLFADQSGSLKQ